jgi:hypothetical protein
VQWQALAVKRLLSALVVAVVRRDRHATAPLQAHLILFSSSSPVSALSSR